MQTAEKKPRLTPAAPKTITPKLPAHFAQTLTLSKKAKKTSTQVSGGTSSKAGKGAVRLLREDPAAFFQRYRGPRPQSAARIPRALWLAHFQTLLGERPPSLPCPPPEAVPLEAQATAAGEVGDSAPGAAAMADRC